MSSASETIINKLVADNKLSNDQKEKAIELLKSQKLNILLVGPTGAGKSSTINALFNTNKAQVGMSPYPETVDISKYDLGNLILWDSPGLGDGKKQDKKHCNIIVKILKKNEGSHALIDLVLVILDGSTRDMGTSYKLINEVVIPNLRGDSNRIIVAINQADIAYKGNNPWNYDENKPSPEAYDFLENKAESVSKRIKESTGVSLQPIYYCAGHKDSPPYNLSKLLWKIIINTPPVKRLAFKDNRISPSEKNWNYSDNSRKYKREIKNSLSLDTLAKGAISIIGGFFGLFF